MQKFSVCAATISQRDWNVSGLDPRYVRANRANLSIRRAVVPKEKKGKPKKKKKKTRKKGGLKISDVLFYLFFLFLLFLFKIYLVSYLSAYLDFRDCDFKNLGYKNGSNLYININIPAFGINNRIYRVLEKKV